MAWQGKEGCGVNEALSLCELLFMHQVDCSNLLFSLLGLTLSLLESARLPDTTNLSEHYNIVTTPSNECQH